MPADAQVGEKPRYTELIGNLNRTRYERYYLNEDYQKVYFENVTVTTRIKRDVP